MAVVVPNLVVIAFDGVAASIPANYSRYTAMDGRYPLGASAGNNGGTTGGNASHTHTEASHTHTANHVHSVSGGAADSNRLVAIGSTGHPSGTHGHNATNSTSASVTSNATTVTLNTTSNDPPYHEVIFVQSNGTVGVPSNCIGWQVPAAAPTGFTLNSAGKFYKGAATSSDPAADSGSSDAHTHTEAGHGHTTTGTHTHGSFNSGAVSANTFTVSTGGVDLARRSHTHSLSLGAADMGSLDTTVSTLQNADGQPPFTKLCGIKNTSGGTVDVPDGFVALWFETTAIPTGWSLMDGSGTTIDMRDRFCKNSTTTETGTGGANQHTHTANTHTHKLPNHASSHAVTAGNGTEVSPEISSFDVSVATGTHNHTWTVVAWTTTPETRPDSGSTTVTVNNNTSADNYPLYLTTQFIQKNYTAVSLRLLSLTGVGQ